ncbi:MAG: hypothetical protein ABF689_06815 [Gluconobacter cerinus]|uniref:hypothetical protein n=1 Tax=Gluconobacter cerinus TaxID=38307 RepID=UPI0039E75309
MAKSVLKGSARVQAQLNGIGRELQGGWMKRLLSRVLRRAQALPHLNAGFLEGASPEKDGTPVAMAAYYNEFGTENIPARPFMRRTIAKNQDQWPKLLAASLKAAKGDLEKALDMTAERIVTQIQAEIESLQDPPLAKSTIDNRLRVSRRNGSIRRVNMQTAVKPLIDTGHMLNSVAHEVVSD